MKHTTKLLVIAAAIVGALGIAGAGWAYWTTTGTGSATASVGTLAAPAILTSSASGSTVSLSWNAVTAPSSGSVSYYVQRDGLTAGGTCPGASAPTAVTSCSDTSVPGGTHDYTVTAVYRSWTATSLPASVTVVPFGPLHHFRVTVPNGVTAGTPVSVTVTAQDADNRTVVSYAGSQAIAFTGPDTAPNGTAPQLPTSVSFTDGVGIASATLYKAESPTLTATQGEITGSSGNFLVAPASAARLAVSSGTTQTAGTAFGMTVTAKDAYGNQATGYNGTVGFTTGVSDPAATGLGNYTFTTGAGNDNGQHVFSVTLKKAVASSGQSIIATDTVTATITGAQTGISVAPASVTSVLVSSGSPQSATVNTAYGTPLVALAKDTYNNLVPGATVTFTAPATGASGTFANGTRTTTATTDATGLATATTYTANTTAGTYNLVASSSGATPANFALTNNPGTATRLAWTHVSIAGAAPSSTCLFTCTNVLGNNNTFTANVSVTDSFGNTVNNVGSGHTVTVTRGGDGGSFTAPGSPPASATSITLTIASTGAADSTQQFTFKAQNGSWTSDSLTAATLAGTVYSPNATATLTKQ